MPWDLVNVKLQISWRTKYFRKFQVISFEVQKLDSMITWTWNSGIFLVMIVSWLISREAEKSRERLVESPKAILAGFRSEWPQVEGLFTPWAHFYFQW